MCIALLHSQSPSNKVLWNFFCSVGEREQEVPYKLCALHCCTAKVLLIKSCGRFFFHTGCFQWFFNIIITLTACITLEIQILWLWKVIMSQHPLIVSFFETGAMAGTPDQTAKPNNFGADNYWSLFLRISQTSFKFNCINCTNFSFFSWSG